MTITVVNVNEAPSAPSVQRGDTTTTPTNNAPEFPATETGARTVPENTIAIGGEDIGAPVEATDADNDDLTYELGGADMASFAIDPATGQLKTKAALDFETKASYSVTVTASDGNMADDATIAVTITVTDVTTGLAIADPFDLNKDEVIGGREVAVFVQDYLAGNLELGGGAAAQIVQLYFETRRSN